jgi:glycosyltransferase involved in cell wall biosynthesis
MFVLNKSGDDDKTERTARSTWISEARQQLSGAALNALLYRYRADETFSFENYWTSAPTSALLDRAQGSQIVNLHWTRGLVTSRQARRIAEATGARIVWTLMDLGMLTGGCHYMHGCTGYQNACGRCPRIRSTSSFDISRRNWKHRKRSFTALQPTIVACNRWTRDRAKESSLFRDVRCEIIPLAIDVEVFRPIPRALAREVLGLPSSGRIVFCGALKMGQSRKGMESLVEALGQLRQKLDPERLKDSPVMLLTAGTGANFASRLQLAFPHHHLGLLGDDRSLALAYSAADLFVSPSIEDAGPMMVNESLACGTPVVAYAIGTAADQVETGATGWLAPLGDTGELAHGLARILDSSDPEGLRVRSREVAVAAYSPAHVARRYLDLYADLASGTPR